MSARINLAENTSETNRDTCAQIPPALSNKPLEGKAMLVNTEVIQKQKQKDESGFLVKEETQALSCIDK